MSEIVELYKKEINAWAGDGYAKKADAVSHLKYWKEHGMFLNEHLSVGVEEAPPGW